MIRVAALVVSSKILSGKKADTGKETLKETLTNHQMALLSYDIVSDDRQAIREQLSGLCQNPAPEVILTVGGTGVRPADWTPEATRDVIEKEIPGIGEAMRAESLKKVKTAMLSRGTAGIRERTLIINLPGSPKGMKDNLQVVLPLVEHMVEKISGISVTS